MLPLPNELVPELVHWLSGRLPDDVLWPGDWGKHKQAGRLLRHDLENAGIAWQDAQGRFADFHALRHTLITNLGRHGVSLTTAQKLARHSTPVLTAARYTHIDLAEQKKAVDLLPLQRQLQRPADFSGQQAASAGTPTGSPMSPPESKEPLENRGSRKKLKRRGGGTPSSMAVTFRPNGR
ncbi:tyrosine-type recombinase/integrase [bacterium]|nr:tyrosine-type recombinase/integrase [bacterium]